MLPGSPLAALCLARLLLLALLLLALLLLALLLLALLLLALLLLPFLLLPLLPLLLLLLPLLLLLLPLLLLLLVEFLVDALFSNSSVLLAAALFLGYHTTGQRQREYDGTDSGPLRDQSSHSISSFFGSFHKGSKRFTSGAAEPFHYGLGALRSGRTEPGLLALRGAEAFGAPSPVRTSAGFWVSAFL
jgi:hypothetical protein